MRVSYFILSATLTLAAVQAPAEVVFPTLSGTEAIVLPRGVNALDAGGVALGSDQTFSDWSRISNLDSLGDLLILDYQSVAMSAGESESDGIRLSVLASDVRRDRTLGEVATRFFAPARHLWQGAAEVSVSPVQTYDLPQPTLDLSAPRESTSPEIGGPTSTDMLGSLSLIGLLWH